MKNRIVFLLVILTVLWGNGSWGAEESAPLIGDESDGSRAVPVHRIPLLDEGGQDIRPDDDPLFPFSPHQTCAVQCHNYETIAGGWHFNASDANVPPGRPGHPWIFWDADTGTQIPLSYRAWPGTYKPDQLGMTPWDFVQRFGRHLPGGGVGDFDPAANSEKTMRILVSGKLEANCLACHDADPSHDQTEYAVQIAKENLRWAAASTSGFASVSGSAQPMPDTYDYQMPEPPDDPKILPPSIEYRSGIFDTKNKVFFDIVRKIPSERCYFCHSSKDTELTRSGKWVADEDVHGLSGLTCVDCHRNGLDHNIVRGYPEESDHSKNPLAAVSSCEGCHLGEDPAGRLLQGRLGAPVPLHRGIPEVHFEKMTCTACHSGSWPESQTHRVKTSLAHGLGTRNVDKGVDALPAIQTPIFARGANGKISPCNLLWPSFWGTLDAEKISPIDWVTIQKIVTPITRKLTRSENGQGISITAEAVHDILVALTGQGNLPGKPVYVSGGKVYRLDDQGKLGTLDHPAAQPYLWSVAHDVRPAAQSLGSRGCTDCHSLDSPFFFGTITVDSPIQMKTAPVIRMVELMALDPVQVKTLALSFRFRPWFKAITLLSAGILIAVILVFALKGLFVLLEFVGRESEPEKKKP